MGVRLRLYGCERMRRERMIGECIVSFSSLPAALDYPLEQWLTLEPRSNITVRHIHVFIYLLVYCLSNAPHSSIVWCGVRCPMSGQSVKNFKWPYLIKLSNASSDRLRPCLV